MKLGFICLNVPGHLNPMTALALQLQARNHEFVFLYSSGAAGLPFVPSPEKDHFNENRPEVSRMHGEDAVRFSVRAVLAETETIFKFIDLNMMMMLTGGERTLSKYHALLKQAGFRLDKSSPIRLSTPLIEAVATSNRNE